MRRALHYTGVMAIAMLATGLTGCKGRTTDNVEPTGDTIEVVIDAPDTAEVANYDHQVVTLPDSIPVPD
ncbi:MAG: hypothetical protein HDS22_07080 [Bacteroides sp.]|nr:hypothetical protein [Bacteroides sp.]